MRHTPFTPELLIVHPTSLNLNLITKWVSVLPFSAAQKDTTMLPNLTAEVGFFLCPVNSKLSNFQFFFFKTNILVTHKSDHTIRSTHQLHSIPSKTTTLLSWSSSSRFVKTWTSGSVKTTIMWRPSTVRRGRAEQES